MTGPKERPKSVALAAEKARQLRVERLKIQLGGQKLENPAAAIDALMAEAGDGDPQVEMWEQLHACAYRSNMQAGLSEAYNRCVLSPRMKKLSRQQQAEVLMHAADWFQGIMGDTATADSFLEKVLAITPGHEDAFSRLEKRYEKNLDHKRMLELYATVADAPPRAVQVFATQALNRLLPLKASDVVSPEACRKLVALVNANPKLLDALENHARATKRPALACELIEQALLYGMPEEQQVQRRQRLLELYLGEAASPIPAVAHVEKLLERDPTDAVALKAGERLLGVREVNSRAAAALSNARRARGG